LARGRQGEPTMLSGGQDKVENEHSWAGFGVFFDAFLIDSYRVT
jgi:hypothetical protein